DCAAEQVVQFGVVGPAPQRGPEQVLGLGLLAVRRVGEPARGDRLAVASHACTMPARAAAASAGAERERFAYRLPAEPGVEVLIHLRVVEQLEVVHAVEPAAEVGLERDLALLAGARRA